MRLKSLNIRGFGRLRGPVHLDVAPGHVALLLERNETGKSTLAAAVLAALYGLRRDRRRARGTIVEQELYRPWTSGAYGIALTLEIAGEELLVDRDLERGSVRVLLGSEDITDRYQQGSRIAVGEGLTGLSREQFTLSSFVGQGDIVWNDPAQLTEVLQRVADSQSAGSTAAEAIQSLRGALERYDGLTLAQPGRVSTEIKRCEDRLESDRSALGALEEERRQLAAKLETLERAPREQHRFAVCRELLRSRRLLHELQETEDKVARNATIEEQIRQQQTELDRHCQLLTLDAHALEEVSRLKRELDAARALLGKLKEDADQADMRRRSSRLARDQLPLTRRPQERDLDALARAHVRWSDAEETRLNMERELESQARALQSRGYRLDEATLLAQDFEALREEDRLILIDRGRSLRQRETEDANLRSQISQWQHRLHGLRRERGSRLRFGWFVSAIGGALIVVGTFVPAFAGQSLWLRWLPGALLTTWGIVAALRAARHRNRDEADAKQGLQQLHDRELQLQQESDRENLRWEELAGRLNLDPEGLEERYRSYRIIEQHLEAVRRIQGRLAEAQHQQAQVHEDLGETVSLFTQTLQPERLAELSNLTLDALRVHQRADGDEAIADGTHRRVEEHEAQLREYETRLRALLDQLGTELAPETNLEVGLQRLENDERHAHELARVRDEVIPELRQRALSPEQRAQLEIRREELRAERNRLHGELRSALASVEDGTALLPMLDEALDPSQYDRELRQLELQEQDRRTRYDEDRSTARAFLARYEIEAPRLRSSIDEHERALCKARRFEAAVELALRTLEEISRDTHRTWASALNQHARALLRQLNDEVEQVSFDPQLRPVLVQQGRTLTAEDARRTLSVGALDGIYLAARLAVSAFLGRGRESLPLILDDPFADLDDERLLAGMRLLLDVVAPRQQVLLMACQRSRYEWACRELGNPAEIVPIQIESQARLEGEGQDVAPASRVHDDAQRS